MKKIFFAILIIALSFPLFAEGGAEDGAVETFKIVALSGGGLRFPESESYREYEFVEEYNRAKFLDANPNVTEVELIYRGVNTGSQVYDMMRAAGTPPDVYTDATGYFEKLLNADYAIPLEKYLDLSRYQEQVMDIYKKNGHQYAIPVNNVAVAMTINLSLLREAGIEIPAEDEWQEQWTTDNFLIIAEALKQIGIPATAIQGKEGLNDWTCFWIYAFGARFFDPMDWSTTTINSPEAYEALEYIKLLVDRGYAMPDAFAVSDDNAVEAFVTNKLFSSAMQNGHTDPSFPAMLAQGKITEIPDYTFVEFPHSPRLDHAPVSGYQTISSGHVSGNPIKDQLISDYIYLHSGPLFQHYVAVVGGGFPIIKGLAPMDGMAALPSYQAIAKVSKTAGYYQQWPSGPAKFAARRPWKRLSDLWIRGKITTTELLDQYEAEANEALKEFFD